MTKQELRKLIKGKLELANNLDLYDISLSKNLKYLLSDLNIGHKLKLGGYGPIQSEPVWFKEFGRGDYEYSLVYTHEDWTLSYHKVQLDELAEEKLVPSLSGEKLACEVLPDVVLVPGLAFTRSLDRLGRGRACFDNYLKSFSGTKVGVFYSLQEVEDVLSEEHDEKLDYIVTNKEILRGNKNDN